MPIKASLSLVLTAFSSTLLAQDSTPPSAYCAEMDKHPTDLAQARLQVTVPMTEFAVDMYRQRSRGSDNTLFSPFSLSTALSMTQAGAIGETSTEIVRALRLAKAPDTAWQPLRAGVDRILTCSPEGRTTQFKTSNALFPQKGKGLLKSYVTLLKSSYNAQITEVNYTANPEAARVQINQWVDRETNHRIPELVMASDLSTATRLTIVNTIFMKARWLKEFAKEDTKPGAFKVTAKKSVQVPMMHVAGGAFDFSYIHRKTFEALTLLLADNSHEMVIFLPKGQDLASLEKDLTREMIDAAIKDMESKPVNVTLPRFKITATLRLVPDLEALGIKRLFDPKLAQLDGIDGGAEKLFASAVVQKAFLDVNEEGLEAAAATAVMMKMGAAMSKPKKPVEFVADHPFVFLIRERSTNAILFMGRLMDPTAN